MARRNRGLLGRLSRTIEWGAVAVLVMLLIWFFPRPTDLLTALLRARDAVASLLPDLTITTVRGDVCGVAGESQSHAFEDMNVNDCNRMVRVVTNTSLTPGTGQLRLNLYASATGSSTNSSIQ